MSNYTKLIEEVENYCLSFRNGEMAPFNWSGIYDLFPERGDPHSSVEHKWNDYWRHVEEAGVYAFLESDLSIFYIGKASMRNGLGYRLNSYCTYADKTKERCKLKKSWRESDVRYLVTIAMPQETRFEAAALEEYLLSKIKTSVNVNGINKRHNQMDVAPLRPFGGRYKH